jgi:hypothetical protein
MEHLSAYPLKVEAGKKRQFDHRAIQLFTIPSMSKRR